MGNNHHSQFDFSYEIKKKKASKTVDPDLENFPRS